MRAVSSSFLLEGRKFGEVTPGGVLVHLDDPFQFLTELCRLTPPTTMIIADLREPVPLP